MRKDKIVYLISVLLLFMLVISGCSGKEAANTEDVISENKDNTAELTLSDAETEQEYLAVAKQCEENGDTKGQYEALEMMVRLYPTVENAALLDEVIVRYDVSEGKEDGTDEVSLNEIEGNLAQIKISLEAGDMDAVAELIVTDSWQKNFLPVIQGIHKKTLFAGDEYQMQITASSSGTQIWCLNSDNTIYLFEKEGTKTIYMQTVYGDASYNGEMTVHFQNAETENNAETNTVITGTFTNAVCTGELIFDYNGTVYTGTFDEQGKTTETQDSTVSQNGGVVYAYDENEKTFLYVPEQDADTFVIDSEFLGVPVFTNWE